MMKRHIAFLLVLTFFISIPLAANADFKRTKIAVLDFSLKGSGFETEDMGAIVAEWFITAFVKEGRFDVVERGLLKKILNEQKLGMSGVVDETTATKIGKLLGVKIIISGSVLKLQNILEINARIIDVETASIIAAENVKSSAAAQLQDLVVQMSAKIIKNFPLEGYVVSRKTGKMKASIDLGRIAGVKEGMEFIVYKEGKIIRHPKTKEVLDVETIETGRLIITKVRNKISKTDIVEEKTPGAVKFGQMVKSVGPLTPIHPEATVDRALRTERSSRRARKRAPVATVSQILYLLKSPNSKEKIKGAQYTVKSFPTNPQLLKVAEQELLKGYEIKTRDRNHAEAMAWMCNVLGRSKQVQYKTTLEMVIKNAASRRVKKYAKKNYRLLK
ncbi:MAG: FlgO family outer membrane protein [Desulfobacterales bacterium]|nr:FlgO family outer membrane protein [Desulfobacterales bacterium]